MPRILDAQAKRLGDKVFVRDRERQVSYRELSEASNRIANFLIRQLGVVKHDKIAVLLPNCVEYFHVQFGIAKAGGVMAPVNVLAKQDLLVHFLNNSDASIVVVDAQFLPLLDSVADAVPGLKTLVVRGDGTRPGPSRSRQVVGYQDLFSGAPTHPDCAIEWYDPVDIFYTSGTTGVSKGVVLPYNHHYVFGRTIASSARLGPEDVMYICLPLYHGMGSYMSIMPMLLQGGSIALSTGFGASRWLSEIREFGATATWAVYSMAPILMKQPERPDDADNPLKVYLFSGMAPDMVERFEKRFDLKVIDHYGATESGHLAYSLWDKKRAGAVGPVNSEHYEVAVVDEHDSVLPPGEIGECVSRCKLPYIQMSEYYKMPEETLKVFRNRWLHSGDLCRIDKDGWLYFVGRGKDTIRRRGENISCFELESILQGYEAIEECAAIPVPSEMGEDEVKVIISPRPGTTVEYDAVMLFCRDHMPKFMVPRYIEIVAEVPKLPNHKIDKTSLKKAGLSAATWDAETGRNVGA
jgi:carnitine-CoA ligase